MTWELSYRADPRARTLADCHYSRQKPGAAQFVPPGRCLVLFAETMTGRAYWVTSWSKAEYTHHDWPGAWLCSAFRNENAGVASVLIREGVAATRFHFGAPPLQGMVTFIDRGRVRPTMVHGVKCWGWSFEQAGFHHVGETKGGLMVRQLMGPDMPPAEPACGESYQRLI